MARASIIYRPSSTFAANGGAVLKRIAIAALIALGIYGVAAGAGTLLYATGAIATGATNNSCDGIRALIAREQGIGEEDVPQSELKARTQACLDTHELTKREAFRTEYLFWSVWPAAICAALFLAWPWWARVLHRQELSDAIEDASRVEMGT